MKLKITEGELFIFALDDTMKCDAKNIFYKNKPNVRLKPNNKVFDLEGLEFSRLLVLSSKKGIYPPKVSIADILPEVTLRNYNTDLKVVLDIYRNEDGSLDVNVIDCDTDSTTKDFVSKYYIKLLTRATD